jgi:hypothetical protein
MAYALHVRLQVESSAAVRPRARRVIWFLVWCRLSCLQSGRVTAICVRGGRGGVQLLVQYLILESTLLRCVQNFKLLFGHHDTAIRSIGNSNPCS